MSKPQLCYQSGKQYTGGIAFSRSYVILSATYSCTLEDQHNHCKASANKVRMLFPLQ